MNATVHTTPVIEQTKQIDSSAMHRSFRQEAGDLLKTFLLFGAVSGVSVIIALSVNHHIFIS